MGWLLVGQWACPVGWLIRSARSISIDWIDQFEQARLGTHRGRLEVAREVGEYDGLAQAGGDGDEEAAGVGGVCEEPAAGLEEERALQA